MASVFEINFNIMLKIKEKHFIKMVLMLIWCVFPKSVKVAMISGGGNEKVCLVNIWHG